MEEISESYVCHYGDMIITFTVFLVVEWEKHLSAVCSGSHCAHAEQRCVFFRKISKLCVCVCVSLRVVVVGMCVFIEDKAWLMREGDRHF